MTTEKEEQFSVMFADGREQPAKATLTTLVQLQIGELTWKDRLHLIQMGKFDLILEKPWLTEFNPSIDFEKTTLTLTHNDQCYRLAATGCGLVIYDHKPGEETAVSLKTRNLQGCLSSLASIRLVRN